MTATTPARLGIWDELRPQLEAAGWLAGEQVDARAVPLLEEVRRGPEPEAALERLAGALGASPELARAALADPGVGRALVAIAGASRALTRTLRHHPDWLLAAVRGDAGRPAGHGDTGTLRQAVRRGLLRIAVGDLLGETQMPEVGRRLADLADDAAAAALDLADREARQRPDLAELPPIPFLVVAMGKWGGRELNYASDIDLLFVYESPEGADAGAVHDYAQRTAAAFMEVLGGIASDGVAFRVDADLRPEGKAGPLARSLDAYVSYYDRWAEPWEFQALIKSRPAAGDPGLAARFTEVVTPRVYPESLPPDSIRQVRSMKSRAEAHTERRGRAHTEIKRGVGGIRDVEFSVQLLQLVHGRSDATLRGQDTLSALEALHAGGYVRPDDAAALHEAYRWLRDLEHRIQLWDLRQTHELPTDDAARERIAKAMRYRDGPESSALAAFEADLVRYRAAVRTIHERLFYRPLLEAFAESPAVRLTEEGAQRQLAALGFRDAAAARRAFDDLTAGLSRRSRLMRQLLPLMLDWLSAAPDPDLGLAQLRMLVTSTSDNARLVAALRDNPAAAERLCRVLGTSRLLGRLLDRIPQALASIGDDAALDRVPEPEALAGEALLRVKIRDDLAEAKAALRRFVRGGVLRVALRDLLDRADVVAVGQELADLADAAAAAALDLADHETRQRPDLADLPPIPFLVLAMGKWGGRELNYASDLDLLFVYDPPPGADPVAANDYALRVATAFQDALGGVTPEGVAFRVDADLRPEGKKGALARSLDAYAAYYERWVEPWELQALIKARPAAGDPGLAARFAELVTPYVYAETLPAETIRHVRHMKARIEKERIPPHEDARFHMKLGTGGLADVEFTTQLLQLTHGGRHPRVREAGTLAALGALDGAHLISPADARSLADAYRFCARVRNRLYLQAGKVRDSLPADPEETVRLALSLGYDHHPGSQLREEYRRRTRRARKVVDRRFYGME